MKKLPEHLRHRTLTVLFLAALVSLVVTVALEEWMPAHGPVMRTVSLLLFVEGILLLWFIAWRLARFRGRFFTLLRRLVAGDYDVGLPVPARWRDEVSILESLIGKLAEQLRTYDELRTRRIRQLRMTLDLIVEHTEEPMMLFDVEKGTLEFNAAMVGILDAAKQTVPLSALRNLEPNKPFVEMLLRTVEDEKSPWEGRVAIQLPAQDGCRETHVRIIPFKDKNESVPLAVVFGKSFGERTENQ